MCAFILALRIHQNRSRAEKIWSARLRPICGCNYVSYPLWMSALDWTLMRRTVCRFDEWSVSLTSNTRDVRAVKGAGLIGEQNT